MPWLPAQSTGYATAMPAQLAPQVTSASAIRVVPNVQGMPVASIIASSRMLPSQGLLVGAGVSLGTSTTTTMLMPGARGTSAIMVGTQGATTSATSIPQPVGTRPDKYVDCCYEEFKGPFTEILQFLATQGLIQGLPLDSQGQLHVSVPFCGSFIECAILSQWLASNFLNKPLVRGVHVLGTELKTDETHLWDLKERWVAETFPGMQLTLKQTDLVVDALPEAGLTIGIHPEVTRGAPWDKIIANLLRSTRGGVVLLAHFFQEEAQAAVDMCAAEGVECQVFENQYYSGRSLPDSPWMRFFLVARPGKPGTPMPHHPGTLQVRPGRPAPSYVG